MDDIWFKVGLRWLFDQNRLSKYIVEVPKIGQITSPTTPIALFLALLLLFSYFVKVLGPSWGHYHGLMFIKPTMA